MSAAFDDLVETTGFSGYFGEGWDIQKLAFKY
jgi:hypothetical protein